MRLLRHADVGYGGRCPSRGAQTFTGGVRGAVSDANGVIPGVSVTIINEGTQVSRDTTTNASGEYNFSAVPPATYTIRAAPDRLQDLRAQGRPHRDAAVPHARHHARSRRSCRRRSRSPPTRRSSRRPTRRTGGTLDREVLEALPAPGRNAFLIGVTVPTVVADRRSAVQPPAGSDQRLADFARRRRRARQQLPARRRADHRAARPRRAQSDDRSARGSEGPGAHLRRRDGPHRRRRVQRDGASPAPTSFTAAASTRPARCGASARTSSSRRPASRRKRAGCPTPTTACTAAASADRSGRTGRSSGPRPKAIDPTRRATSSRSGRALKQRTGDFSTSTIGGVPVRIFNPYCRGGVASAKCPATGTGSLATGGEFTGAIIPRTHPAANAAGFGLLGAWPTQTIAGAIAGNENNEPNASATGPIVDFADMFTIKARAQVQRHLVAQRFVHLQQDRRARQHDHAAGRVVHRQPGQLLRAAAPPAARGGDQQHQRPQRHHGPDASATASPRGRTRATSSRSPPASVRWDSVRTMSTPCRRRTCSPT